MATPIERAHPPDVGHDHGAGETRTDDQLDNGRNNQQNIHRERMHDFMSMDGIWSGSICDSSKKVPGVINYQIRQNAWKKGDFPELSGTNFYLKDAIGKRYMEWDLVMRTAKHVKACMDVKDLLTMSKNSIARCISPKLRQKFEQRQPITDADLSDFQRYASTDCPLVITGRKDHQKMIFRLRISYNFIVTLGETKHLLPQYAPQSGWRGDYKTRNYCLWTKYAKHPYMSADLLEDGQAAKDWLAAQAPLFKYLSEALKHVDFHSYENMSNHPWLDSLLVNKAWSLGQKPRPGHVPSDQEVPLHKVAGIWCGLALNCDQEYSGMPHRDTTDVKHSLNCVIPWGDYEGADLLFREIRKRVQVSPGEVIFFRSRALTHNVSPLPEGGVRNIVDLYSHQGILDVDREKRGHSTEDGKSQKRKWS